MAFKLDLALYSQLAALPNMSAFIRGALCARLAGACPHCGGTGVRRDDDRAR